MVKKSSLVDEIGHALKETRLVPRDSLRTAPCQEACPAGVDVPRYIRYIKKGLFKEALSVNREAIPFPDICAYACFNPCENKCAMNQFGEPLAIRALKRVAAEKGNTSYQKRKRTARSTNKKIAVIGAGPCGLTAAYYLATLGHQITIFDANPKPGGTMRYGIPRYRLPEKVLNRNIRDIMRLGITFKPNVVFGKNIKLKDLQDDFDATLISIGATLSRKLDIPGAHLRGVLWGLEFLQDVAAGKKMSLKKRVLVVGGGNVAVDVALTAKRLGAETIDLVSLETRNDMPAHEWEIARAEEEGVTLYDACGLVRILGEKNVTGVELKKCLCVFDKNGAFNPCFDEKAGMKLSTDTVILAIGQVSDVRHLPSQITRENNLISVQEKSSRTGEQGIFAAGDAVTGPQSIIHAVARGREAAVEIDRFLGGNGEISEVLARSETEVEISDERQIERRRQPVPFVSVAERVKSFEPVELGYTVEQARKEAGRCLNCDARRFQVSLYPDNCKACGYCAEVCKMDVFAPSDEFNKRGVKPMQVQKAERCVGCLMCFYACPDFAIEVKEIRPRGEEK